MRNALWLCYWGADVCCSYCLPLACALSSLRSLVSHSFCGAGHQFTRAGGADNLDNEKILEDLEGGVCLGATPCGSQAYPYLLYLQVILWLVEGSRWRSALPEAQLKDKFRGGPTL